MSNDLGKILKQRRVVVPLTLQELAHASGISPSYLGRIERGGVSPRPMFYGGLPAPWVLRRVSYLF